MSSPLLKIKILSIYELHNQRVDLPERMARCTPDTLKAVHDIAAEVKLKGGELILSDMFRSYEMQTQANLDFVTHKKTAFSPPAGGSMHEAGRALDLDLKSLKMPLADFWKIAAKHGMNPIISQPDSGKDEAWHFDCQGSHKMIYDYYKAGKATNLKPYTAMAASAILSIGVKVDHFKRMEKEAFIQSGIIRLGGDIGSMDGAIGPKSKLALQALGIALGDVPAMFAAMEQKLKQKFPAEYEVKTGDVVVVPSQTF